MSSRIEECKSRCTDLISKLDRRVQFDIHVRVKGTQDDQKSMPSVLITPSLDTNTDIGFQGDKIERWMSAPDSSPNYNAAREKHQPETGSWFIEGNTFREWKEQPGSVLWLHGGRKSVVLKNPPSSHALTL